MEGAYFLVIRYQNYSFSVSLWIKSNFRKRIYWGSPDYWHTWNNNSNIGHNNSYGNKKPIYWIYNVVDLLIPHEYHWFESQIDIFNLRITNSCPLVKAFHYIL